MEMRRQVTVSWDSGGSDEAPPKVSFTDQFMDSLSSLITVCLSVYGFVMTHKQKPTVFSACSPVDPVTPVLVPVKASSPAPSPTTSRYVTQTVLLCSFSSTVAAADVQTFYLAATECRS